MLVIQRAMKRGRFLLALWCCSILGAVTCSFKVEDYLCVSDYLKSISCALNISDDLGSNSNNYTLRFTNRKSSSCPLVATGHGYHCVCNVKGDKDFSVMDEFLINLCFNSTCRQLYKYFYPIDNVKLSPPPETEIQQSSEWVNITCKSKAYESHRYLKDNLDFEVLLRDSLSNYSRTIRLHSKSNVQSIITSELPPNAELCIQVRFKPDKKTGYKATWSEWSEPKCWKNKVEEEQENIFFMLLKYLGPVCVLAGLLLIVFFSPVTRMKIKTLAHTPTPAPFFQPLFQKHEGNLQDWLSHQSNFALPYKTEKDLIADAVTVLPKPIVNDPEESQVFLSISAPHLTFPQRPTSYVGLPVMPKAPPPLTVVCPGDPPYTQLPSVWTFSVSDLEIVSCPPEGFLEISHTDSGCSCEDLIQSPGCSLPSSPVGVRSPLLYCTDYCTLNRTATGVVPVLLSKESNRNVPLVPPKAEG